LKVIRPYITLVALLAVGVLCQGLMWVFPDEGLNIAGIKLKFGNTAVADTLAERKIEDVEKFLAQFDSLQIAADSLTTDSTAAIIRKETIASLQFANGDSSPLFPFFESCDSAKTQNKHVHVFHYGDSQIEVDRMTNVLRQKLQERFGGNGPGLIAPIPIAASANIAQTQSENWKRYTSYGFDNGKATHNNYGVMCSFGRFTAPVKKDSEPATDTTQAWIEVRPSGMSLAACKIWSEAWLYFGNFTTAFRLQVTLDGTVLTDEIIEPEAGIMRKTWSLQKTGKLRFNFFAIESPDVYALELHGGPGINVSNIALRGNDGGAFRRVNNSSMQRMTADLNAELIILQFGGNAVPFLSGASNAEAYGNSFRDHIRKFRQLIPDVPIIVIGPSDMSTSVDGVFQTWPYLENLRDGMKKAALEEGCAFWDMYEVMGGKNSMVSWVTNNPPYAGPDYTHFTPAGARKMAELLYKAIADEYDAWKAVQSGN
jgi:lysophospholipase L1-like esterase